MLPKAAIWGTVGIRRKVKYFISFAIYFSLKEKFVYWRNIPLAMNQVGKFYASERNWHQLTWFLLYRLLFLYLRAHSHRDGHSYCSSQGCERVKIQAATDSKDISNCMAKAYPQYYKKPSAVKRMPAMLTGLCQGCGTHQVSREKEGTCGGKSQFLVLAVGVLGFGIHHATL